MYSNLKLEMWRQGIRQNRLAKMLDMDETLLSRIVNGFRKPKDETKARIAAALGRDERWLFETDVQADAKLQPTDGFGTQGRTPAAPRE